jgi:hypothetical protein
MLQWPAFTVRWLHLITNFILLISRFLSYLNPEILIVAVYTPGLTLNNSTFSLQREFMDLRTRSDFLFIPCEITGFYNREGV